MSSSELSEALEIFQSNPVKFHRLRLDMDLFAPKIQNLRNYFSFTFDFKICSIAVVKLLFLVLATEHQGSRVNRIH